MDKLGLLIFSGIGFCVGALLAIYLMEADIKSGDVVFGGVTYICEPTLMPKKED